MDNTQIDVLRQQYAEEYDRLKGMRANKAKPGIIRGQEIFLAEIRAEIMNTQQPKIAPSVSPDVPVQMPPQTSEE